MGFVFDEGISFLPVNIQKQRISRCFFVKAFVMGGAE
jgi:hypothetical protein